MNEKNELVRHDGAEDGAGRRKADPQKGRGPKKERGHRWLFLAVDLFLLLAIVGAVIFIVTALSSDDTAKDGTTEARRIVYQIELAGVEEGLFTLNGGEAVINAADGSVIGTVEYHDGGRPYAEYIDAATKIDDKYFATKGEYREDLKTYLITVYADADYEASVGYFVEGCRIAVGREYTLRFGSYVCTGVCVSLQYNQ